MTDKKENDFWGKSDDDFWNKPVITGDWLNNKNEQAENTQSQSSNTDVGNPYAGTGNPYTDMGDDRYGSFYVDTASYQEEPTYGIPNQPAYTYQRNENSKEQRRGRTIAQNSGNKKKFPIFAWINLIFLALTLIVVSVSILAAGHFQTNADYRNRKLDYERIVMEEDSFPVYDNNIVTLAWDACTVFSQDTDKQLLGIPEGEILIAVPVQVESDEYKSGQYALRDMFIGCNLGEQRVFRRCVRDETIFSVLAIMGFKRNEMCTSYGLGNGSDESGFFFFFVPEKTREITFYAEERKTEQKISVLTRRYEKNLAISDHRDIEEWLEEVRESEGWQ